MPCLGIARSGGQGVDLADTTAALVSAKVIDDEVFTTTPVTPIRWAYRHGGRPGTASIVTPSVRPSAA
jgi:hypothetical protein